MFAGGCELDFVTVHDFGASYIVLAVALLEKHGERYRVVCVGARVVVEEVASGSDTTAV
jgi:hypothetical protein